MFAVMLSLLVAMALSDFPVTLPKELGHLKVISGESTDKGIEIELEYLNDTELTFSSVGIECTLIDHRETIVTSEFKDVNNDKLGMAPGKRLRVKMIVSDHTSRGRRTECVVTRGVIAEAQQAEEREREREGVERSRNVSEPTREDRAPSKATESVKQPVEEETPVTDECCKKCRGGTKACGNDCISEEKICRKKPGCACN